MNGFALVLINLTRRPTRTVLTGLSVMIAFLLFMLLQAVSGAFSGGGGSQQIARLYVDSRYSQTANLPMSHIRAMAEVEDVVRVAPMVWFGGYYQEPANAFAKIATDPDAFLEVFAEVEASADAIDRWRNSRRAVLVEASIAEGFGWQVGDAIPIVGDIWPKEDGSWDWQFELAGTYATPPGSRVQAMFLLRHDYYSESVAEWTKNQAGWAVVRVTDHAATEHAIAAIDKLFENSVEPTLSLTEDAYAQRFARQLGDIGTITTLILVAVFFTLLLLTANVASAAMRERLAELAVMKTLGFSDRYVAGLVFGEALILCALGALIGIALGYAVEAPLQGVLAQVLSGFALAREDALLAMALALGLGVLIGAPPALAAARLPIVESLRERH